MPTATVTQLKPTRSAELLGDCRKQAETRLPEALKFVLTQADDALFELANKADNSTRQNLYFDAMRELRLKRGEFETAFMRHFDTNFADSLDLAKAKASERGFEPEGELSLVEIDEVEQVLAVTNFADSIRSRSREELFALDKRLGALLSVSELDGDQNPLGPKAIGDALRAACQVLDADVEIKLTLLKLFDRFAGQAVHQLYQEVNRSLIAADVLPNITANVQSNTTRRRTRVIIESEDDSVEASGEDVFSTLQHLMQGTPLAGGGPRRGSGSATGPGMGSGFADGSGSGAGTGMGTGGSNFAGGGSGGVAVYTPGGAPTASDGPAGGISGSGPSGGAGGAGFGGGSFGGGAMLAGAPLVQGLTTLQRGGNGGESVWGAVDQAQVASGMVNVLHSLRDSGSLEGADSSENLTLEVVSLLFDYILGDAAIPDALKALIGRLQIPVLKVALLDRAVFSKKQHPARRLLDELGQASIGWSEGLRQQDALYDKVEEVVHRILDEFEDDVSLFETVLEDFLAFVAAEAEQAEARAEKSTRSLHTKERIIQAKMDVDDEIRARLNDHDLREFIHNFILDYWRQLLIVTLVESGRDSEAWRSRVKILEELIWSAEPKTASADRKILVARLPALVKGLKLGMQELDMTPTESSRFLSMLASVHVASVRSDEEQSVAERRLAEAQASVTARRAQAEARIAEKRAGGKKSGAGDPASEEFIRKGLERIFEKQEVGALELDIDFSVFEPSAEADADNAADDESPTTFGDDTIEQPRDAMDSGIVEFSELVGTLDLGDWLELREDDGTTSRVRFTWISPETGRYLFTTRSGEKALDTTMMELAVALQQGRAAIIKSDPDPLFERALGNLIEKLEAEAAPA